MAQQIVVDALEWQTNSLASAQPATPGVAGFGGDYLAGVQNSRYPWQARALAGVTNWQNSVSQGNAGAVWQASMAGITTANWKTLTLQKATLQKWTSGINSHRSKYQTAFQPYANAIANAVANNTAPPRGPRGSAENKTRANYWSTLMHQTKLSLATGG